MSCFFFLSHGCLSLIFNVSFVAHGPSIKVLLVPLSPVVFCMGLYTFLFLFFIFGEKKISLKQTNQEQGNAC